MRQFCNVVYSLVVDEISVSVRTAVSAGAKFETDDPIGERIQKFEEELGLRTDPMKVALEMQKQFMAMQGLPWDDTPVKLEEDRWWDQDIEYTSMGAFNETMTHRKE